VLCVCVAADRSVSVLSSAERGESNYNGEHHARDQLHVYGLQRRTAQHARYDDRPHLCTCSPSARGVQYR